MKTYLQLCCGEYYFLLDSDCVAEVLHRHVRDKAESIEWREQNLAVIDLNLRLGLVKQSSAHQLILSGKPSQGVQPLMVKVGDILGIVELDEQQFHQVTPFVGEFSQLIDGAYSSEDKTWLRLRSDYFYS